MLRKKEGNWNVINKRRLTPNYRHDLRERAERRKKESTKKNRFLLYHQKDEIVPTPRHEKQKIDKTKNGQNNDIM